MAVPANTVQTIDRVSIREDLTDKIFMITPEETPLISAIGRNKAYNVNHEWQADELKAADGENKHVQGDDTAFETQPATSRLSNYTQIMKKTVITSGTADAVRNAGYATEFAYQASKRAQELKHDMETRVNGNYAKVAPTASIPGEIAGFEAWVTNSSRGVGGADGSTDANGFGNGVTAATDGTQRAFTEVMIKDIMQQCRVQGGKPSLILVGPNNKQVFSGFSGIAANNIENTPRPAMLAIFGAARTYISDFGDLTVVDNVYQRERSALFVDTMHAKLSFLRPVKTEPLAKTGDSRKAQMITELTLEMCNPKAHGIAADLTTS